MCHSRETKSCPDAGFSLMEVLIALVILAIAFGTIFMAISSNTRSLLYLENKTAAHWVGLNVIAAAQLGLIDFTENKSQANTEILLDKRWLWKAKVLPTADISVLRIEVEVMPAGNVSSLAHLSGYLRNTVG